MASRAQAIDQTPHGVKDGRRRTERPRGAGTQNEKVAAAAAALESKLAWRVAQVCTTSNCVCYQRLDRSGVPKWLQKKRDAPLKVTPRLKANCWELPVIAALEAGVIDKATVRKVYEQSARDGAAAYLLARKPQQGNRRRKRVAKARQLGLKAYLRTLLRNFNLTDSVPYIGQDGKRAEIAPGDLVVDNGGGSIGHHFTVATGRTDALGRPIVMSLHGPGAKAIAVEQYWGDDPQRLQYVRVLRSPWAQFGQLE